jgi:hypothetical protein
MPTRLWEIPEGLRVLENGQWRVGELDVIHPPTLRHLKAHLVIDDGSEEPVHDTSLGMDALTGRFECRVRGGRTSALFSRGAHQTLLELADEEAGHFFLRAGARRIPIRT